MDVSKLRKGYPLLLEYLRDNGYSRGYIQYMQRCIKLALKEGSSPGITSYEQLYGRELARRRYKETSRFPLTLKSILGSLKQFDLYGLYPCRNHRHGFLSHAGSYNLLGSAYKLIIDHYADRAGSAGKSIKTIYTERLSGSIFLLYLQKAGAQSITEVTERQVLDFFFDGEKLIKSKSFKSSIATVLKSAIDLHGEPVRRLLSFLPHIPVRYTNYPYMTRQESEKFRRCLEEENSPLTLLDKAIATTAYYTGLRGVDILSLTPENIDWEKETIHIVQSKTGVALTLPMCASVGNAIWDYLVHERPKSPERFIFVSRFRPYGKITCAWSHLKKVFNRAGVRNDSGRTGVSLFRHHLATTLLGNRVPPPVISSILGHTLPESINNYVDADIEHLRPLGLSIADYPVAGEVFEL